MSGEPPSIEAEFWDVVYDGTKIPTGVHDLSAGANCQRFAYALLASHGIELPPFRSSDLWEDTDHTEVAVEPDVFDLALFNRTASPWGAHVGVVIGDDAIVHLAKRVGRPVVWPVADFLAIRDYQVLLGYKRPRRRPEP